MSNPWKSNILDRSLDDLATENTKYKKSGQFKKDQRAQQEREKREATAKKKAEAEAAREERMAETIAKQECSIEGRFDLTQYVDEEKLKAALSEFGAVETCSFRFAGRNIMFNAKFEDKDSAAKCAESGSINIAFGDVEGATKAAPIRGRSVYFKNPFPEEDQGEELNDKIKGLFESMATDEAPHKVVSVEVKFGFFSVAFASRDSVKAALSGFFEPLMMKDKKLGPVREGLPSKSPPVLQKRKGGNDGKQGRNDRKPQSGKRRRT
jgi:hypothetical protein